VRNPWKNARAIQNFIFHSEYFNLVIELGMGKSSKKKPMTKKERAERRKRRARARAQVTSKDIRKLLSDSLALGHYPSICISFKADGKFNHYIIPVEEMMSLIKKKSVALGRNELDEGTIRSLSAQEFTDNLLNCEFPSLNR
jgi:hypothetical protein